MQFDAEFHPQHPLNASRQDEEPHAFLIRFRYQDHHHHHGRPTKKPYIQLRQMVMIMRQERIVLVSSESLLVAPKVDAKGGKVVRRIRQWYDTNLGSSESDPSVHSLIRKDLTTDSFSLYTTSQAKFLKHLNGTVTDKSAAPPEELHLNYIIIR